MCAESGERRGLVKLSARASGGREHCFPGSGGCHPAFWPCDEADLEGRHTDTASGRAAISEAGSRGGWVGSSLRA